MSIQKKSLISTLKTAKKANLTKDEISFDHSRNSMKAQPVIKAAQKHNLALKTAAKSSAAMKLATKAASKSSAAMKLATKAASKSSAAVKLAVKN